MSKPIEQRLREQLRKKGMSPEYAAATARKAMMKAGNVKPDGTMTKQGETRSQMGAAGRAKDRAAKAAGRSPQDYTYNQLANRARLKK